MKRLLEPAAIAIVGLSADPSKHGNRVLANLRKVGYPGPVWGVNPGRPKVDGVEIFSALDLLPGAPDLVVCATPAAAALDIVDAAGAVGAGGVVVFAGGFAESGPSGTDLQDRLTATAVRTGVRVLGPNSGGIIRPSVGLAASFLTCLDRPADQIRSGAVGLVTQSGGTGSYLHNLAAADGDGLAVSVSTGNEADLGLADAIAALVDLEEVRAIAIVMETVRDGPAFVEAVRGAKRAGKPVVVCRIGTGRRGERLMTTHTGAMATPAKVLDGVLDALGATVAETPEEMLAVAGVMARARPPEGGRIGVVTHSGGIAILLSDLAERLGLDLPHPGEGLGEQLEPLLELGALANPLDMGAIIGGAGRFAQVVERFAGSGEYDLVLAVSTAHPPAHTPERAVGLLAIPATVPVVHLWMAGDVGAAGLAVLRAADRPVITEPRAAIRALAGLARQSELPFGADVEPDGLRLEQVPRTEHEAKLTLSSWGLPVVEGELAGDAEEAAGLAERLGGAVVLKIVSPDVVHKTGVGGVVQAVVGPDQARRTFTRLVEGVLRQRPGARIEGVRVERMRPGVEVIVGMIRDDVFGPTVLVGLGGIAVEGLHTERYSPAPLAVGQARRLVRSVSGLEAALARTGSVDVALDELAGLVSESSRRFVASGLGAMEMNPIAWTGEGWEILDAVMTEGG